MEIFKTSPFNLIEGKTAVYFLIYCLLYSFSLFWDIFYQSPNSFQITIKNLEYSYEEQSVLSNLSNYVTLRFLAVCFIPAILIVIFSFLSSLNEKILATKKASIERLLCFLLFISLIATFFINPFNDLKTIFNFVEPSKMAVLIITVISSIEMAVCFIFNRRTFHLNNFVLTLLASVAVFIGSCLFLLYPLIFQMDYISFISVINNNSSSYINSNNNTIINSNIIDKENYLKKAIEDFCQRHNFPISNVYIENSIMSSNAAIFNFYFKKFTRIFIGSQIIRKFEVDEILGILEHEISHLGWSSFLFESFLAFAGVFIFIHFIRNRILLNSKNFTVKKVASAVMILLIFLRLYDMITFFLMKILENQSDSGAFSMKDSCSGISSSFAKFITEYKIGSYQPYSLFRTHPSFDKRILEASKKCPEEVQIKRMYLQ